MRSAAILAALGSIALVLCSTLALSGCSATTPPSKISVSVFQYRSDYAPRHLQIEVSNAGSEDIEVVSASFSSAYFAKAMVSKSTPSQVLAGSKTDFPVTISAPDCTAQKPLRTVTVAFSRADGTKESITTVPTDPFDSIGRVNAQDCSKQAFERIATITPASALRFEQDDGKPIALLDIAITPTGKAGSATLESTQDTTLLAQREGQLRAFGSTFTASSKPTTITLDFTPSRCEQHVVAEDKVGTLIPFHASVHSGGDSRFSHAVFNVPVTPAVKNELLDWVGVYCGWGS